MSHYIIVFITVPDRKIALKISRHLVKTKLAACVNIVPGIRSIYKWQGKICENGESLLLIKTRKTLFPKLTRLVKSLHPDAVPEIIALPIIAGDKEYFRWINQVT